MVYSKYVFYVIKNDYLQEKFELILNDKIIEEQSLRNYAGSTIFVQFRQKNSPSNYVFERQISNQLALKQLSLNYSAFFNK